MVRIISLFGVIALTACAFDLRPIPEHAVYDKQKAHLGKKLFFDPILSRDGTVACVTCHLLPGNGAESTSVSTGVDGKKGGMNSPTVLNAVFNFVQFWDGRAKDLKEQAKGPILNPVEMDNSEENVLSVLNNQKEYKKSFYSIYKSELTFDQVVEVIAEFEKALITPNSRFDSYIKGNKSTLSDAEKEGYRLFKERGCISCHNGTNIGGTLYQKIGIFKLFNCGSEHLGRFNITKKEKDKYYFKVPTLRNISQTAPYMHGGKVKTLEEAVEIMYEYQLGILPDKEEVKAIVSFLKTLDGQSPEILKEKL